MDASGTRLTTVLYGIVAVALGAALALVVPTRPASAQAVGRNNVLILLDVSSSMDEYVGLGNNFAKIQAAKQSVNRLVDGIDPDTNVGLRTFSGPCGAPGSLLAGIARVDKPRLHTAVGSVFTGGNTSTPSALRAAFSDLAGTTGNKTIVLVSDGESTCGDPCPVLREAASYGIQVTVNTIGFAVAGTAAEPELQCLAQGSGGQYASVINSDQLDTALRVAASRSTAGYGDLGLATRVSQPVCDGSYVTVVYSAVTPGRYLEAIRANLAKYRGSRYLLTSNTCPSLTPYKDGNLIYAVYYGPFHTLREACAARAPGSYPRVLATDWPWQSYHKC